MTVVRAAKQRLGLIMVAVLGIVVLLAFFLLPPAMVTPEHLSKNLRLQRENDVRTVAIQAIAGLVVVWGAFATWRTYRLNRQGQITERFTRAIEQLGSDSPEVRIGGIYGLERISRDSQRDRWPIVEILSTYVREKSPHTRRINQRGEEILAADVQAALTVVGRRDVAQEAEMHREARAAQPEKKELPLHVRVDLSHADLRWANVRDAHLEYAILWNVDLEGANASNARLGGADLGGACLRGTDLAEADLRKASVRGADLQSANLWGADLREALLDNANLQGSTYSAATHWPEGYDPDVGGARVPDDA